MNDKMIPIYKVTLAPGVKHYCRNKKELADLICTHLDDDHNFCDWAFKFDIRKDVIMKSVYDDSKCVPF